MRVWLAVAFALHVAAVLALIRFGTPRPLDDAFFEPPGITVVFSRGGGGETIGEADADSPQAAVAPPPEATPEAPGEQPSEAQPEAAQREEATAEAEPEPRPPQPAETVAPPSVTALPLPPPPPPEPPPVEQARETPPSPPAAEGEARTRPPDSGDATEQSDPIPGSAGFLFATRPASIGYRVDPVVPIEARQLRMQGRVELVVTISPEGIPMAVDVYRSSGYFLLDRAAEEALWQWRFDPARRGGVPVEDRIVIPFTFRIVN